MGLQDPDSAHSCLLQPFWWWTTLCHVSVALHFKYINKMVKHKNSKIKCFQSSRPGKFEEAPPLGCSLPPPSGATGLVGKGAVWKATKTGHSKSQERTIHVPTSVPHREGIWEKRAEHWKAHCVKNVRKEDKAFKRVTLGGPFPIKLNVTALRTCTFWFPDFTESEASITNLNPPASFLSPFP